MDLPTQCQPGVKGWGQSSSWFSWYQKHLVTLDAELLICESFLDLHAEGKPLISSTESIETGVKQSAPQFKISRADQRKSWSIWPELQNLPVIKVPPSRKSSVPSLAWEDQTLAGLLVSLN